MKEKKTKNKPDEVKNQSAPQIPDDVGKLLIEYNLITPNQLEIARQLQKEQGEGLGEVLIKQRFITPQDFTSILSVQLNLPFIDLTRHKIQPQALELVPELMAREYDIIPLDIIGDELVIVAAHPENKENIESAILASNGYKVQLSIGLRDDIRDAINIHYKATDEVKNEVDKILPQLMTSDDTRVEISTHLAEEEPIARIVSHIIIQAIRERVSDIHLEMQEQGMRVRYRIDGILHNILTLPKEIHPLIISRLKILSDMNIAERRLPQDGQMTFSTEEADIDIRVATINTAYGEKMVLRILDKSRTRLNLTELGFLPDTLEKYRKVLETPNGLLLISGPTGAGKTTTLYATLNELDRIGKNITTVEDPVEYILPDINQVQVNVKAGLTFAAGLRALLRQDPDIILVGELRDSDTAKTGAQAALTGHLVLSSIHANDSSSAALRLINLGVEPFTAATSIICVVAQRMVRRVCPHCRELVTRPLEEQKTYEHIMGEVKKEYYHGAGCNFCSDSGYLGRIGIFEMLVVSNKIQKMLMEESSSSEIRSQAIEEGMVPIIKDGMLKVKEGMTTVSEVLAKISAE